LARMRVSNKNVNTLERSSRDGAAVAAGPSFLNNTDLRLLLFGGKGGVGKTTCASATALHYARHQPERSFLLVSTDPAHSLSDSLAGSSLPGNLQTLEIDAQGCLSDFKNKHNAKLREIASRGTFLDDEDISQFMDLSLPGLDELMAFLEITQLAEDQKHHCIVVDTAPTGHTLRLLAMPELIEKWLDALDALLAKHRYMKHLFAGSYQRDALDEFLLDLSNSVTGMRRLLTDSARCCFVPVLLAEALSIYETRLLLDELERLEITVCDIVVNRLYPESRCPQCSDRHARQTINMRNGYAGLAGYVLSAVPMYPKEVRGADALHTFWENTLVLANPLPSVSIPQTNRQPEVLKPAKLPAVDTKLLLFAGKGGVGKTTMACATAIRMAQALNGRQVLLFSTDPAHSLSACLDTPIGATPTRLSPSLTAMEIDAQSEFETLKDEYAQELEEFLDDISSNFDLAFDRDVMERIMDLSPPGIDEVMALTSVMDFLSQDQFQFIILDSAPTGHLVRLLETPELIDQWLKVFFNLLLKYKHIFRLPKVSQRMVQMSKALKLLQRLLKGSQSSALFGVTILTEMAFEETKDLIAACQRMHIYVPLLFLNLATPPSRCPLCSAVHQREKAIMQKYKQAFADQHQTLVYQQGEPRGLEALGQLGETLYKHYTIDDGLWIQSKMRWKRASRSLYVRPSIASSTKERW